jgi:hypothetical protein
LFLIIIIIINIIDYLFVRLLSLLIKFVSKIRM